MGSRGYGHCPSLGGRHTALVPLSDSRIWGQLARPGHKAGPNHSSETDETGLGAMGGNAVPSRAQHSLPIEDRVGVSE